ncbi:hypothetical protein F1C15_15845 (plasmid) [Frigoribacterium sp. NBH87]|uniref:hypothetical protein n=1 Tax=Frigoribacterium sp. NBH87 TaxID=2596916 RepID=UPI001625E55E|nr:hypothetical protein [Frigoribacterium sp. NBH87]QNE45443.1 hypothetical protein F1C15_15845 [Frigoribacterium sp. NBH87]
MVESFQDVLTIAMFIVAPLAVVALIGLIWVLSTQKGRDMRRAQNAVIAQRVRDHNQTQDEAVARSIRNDQF